MRERTARQDGASRLLSDRLASVDSEEGRQRVAEFIQRQPFPHYEPTEEPAGESTGGPRLLVRIDADGTRTVGRFLQRRFAPVT